MLVVGSNYFQTYHIVLSSLKRIHVTLGSLSGSEPLKRLFLIFVERELRKVRDRIRHVNKIEVTFAWLHFNILARFISGQYKLTSVYNYATSILEQIKFYLRTNFAFYSRISWLTTSGRPMLCLQFEYRQIILSVFRIFHYKILGLSFFRNRGLPHPLPILKFRS